MEDRSEKMRAFFAKLVAAQTKDCNPAIEQAFAAVKRETFVGPGPWSVATLSGRSYVETPDDDPAFIYQDTLVALDPSRGLNMGLPSAHAVWLDAVDVKRGETVLQVGAGPGYYTAILAHLVGADGRVHAYEIDAELAARAGANLKHLSQVEVHPRSGMSDDLPKSDLIYVCVGTTEPSRGWLEAMRPGARLLFPLQPDQGLGGMLLLHRADGGSSWPARFISRSRFICSEGHRDAGAGSRLTEAFSGPWNRVKSFRIGNVKDDTCWFAGDGWWLSTETSEPTSA